MYNQKTCPTSVPTAEVHRWRMQTRIPIERLSLITITKYVSLSRVLSVSTLTPPPSPCIHRDFSALDDWKRASSAASIPVSGKHSSAPLGSLVFLLLSLLLLFRSPLRMWSAHTRGIYTAYLTYSKHDCGGEEDGRDAVLVSSYQGSNVLWRAQSGETRDNRR